jgi:low affinity Fe/Cu permease
MSSQDRSRTVAGPASNGETNRKTLGQRLHRFLNPGPRLGPPINPALLKREKERAEARQNRAADRITAFSGSMLFVYIHIIWFACWIGFGVEAYPYGLLTMIVSLEAIFLSTFVMISQNRADARRQVIADEQWRMVQDEDKQNVELLDLSKQILALTKELHSLANRSGGAAASSPKSSGR